jgi:hypothetical protein
VRNNVHMPLPRPLLFAAIIAAFVFPASAQAASTRVSFEGGTHAQRAQVRAALRASSFRWELIPQSVTVHIGRGFVTRAGSGTVWLDSDLLDAGMFSWGVVQHEFAHQVDFLLLSPWQRMQLATALDVEDWCGAESGRAHGDYGCERFASTLTWAYWPSRSNAFRPESPADESAALPPTSFRSLLDAVLGVPTARAH